MNSVVCNLTECLKHVTQLQNCPFEPENLVRGTKVVNCDNHKNGKNLIEKDSDVYQTVSIYHTTNKLHRYG
jgi:hypothetical protein